MVKIARKSKFKGQLRSKLKKFKTKDLFLKKNVNLRTQLSEMKDEIEEIRRLKVKHWWNKKYPIPKTKLEKKKHNTRKVILRFGRGKIKSILRIKNLIKDLIE